MQLNFEKDKDAIISLLNKYNKDFTPELESSATPVTNNEKDANAVLVFNTEYSKVALQYVEQL